MAQQILKGCFQPSKCVSSTKTVRFALVSLVFFGFVRIARMLFRDSDESVLQRRPYRQFFPENY
jgi:hypothetical protein